MQKSSAKKILFILRQAPQRSAKMREALDIVLMARSLDYAISLIFLGDGVFNLLKQQAPIILDNKNFTSAFKALPLYEVDNIYIAADDLNSRGITVADLMLNPKQIQDSAIQALVNQHELIFNF